jgi:hypothetical protein
MSLTGGCHCGYVQFSIDRDELDDIANCHCSICRRCTGGTFVTWATVPAESLSWTKHAPASYRATPESERYFCPNCGAQLALYTQLAPRTIDITVSTLDKVDCFPPGREIWVGSKIAWVSLSDSLVQEIEETL